MIERHVSEPCNNEANVPWQALIIDVDTKSNSLEDIELIKRSTSISDSGVNWDRHGPRYSRSDANES